MVKNEKRMDFCMVKSKEDILKDLMNLSEEQYKEFHSSLSPETDMILGVRVPIIREYAKTFIKDGEWQENYKNIGNDYNEEKILKGIIIGSAKMKPEERLKYLEEFVPTINSWSSCDITCGTLKFAKKEQEVVWNFLEKYINSDKEFEVRFAIVMYLSYFINDEYVYKVLDKMDNVSRREYYVRMAVAWAISAVIAKFPEIGIKYLKENEKLEDSVYNSAIQKAIDSFRVSDRDKDKLRKLRRKKLQ